MAFLVLECPGEGKRAVEVRAWFAEVERRRLESARGTRLAQGETESVVDDLLERCAALVHLAADQLLDVRVERHGGAHGGIIASTVQTAWCHQSSL